MDKVVIPRRGFIKGAGGLFVGYSLYGVLGCAPDGQSVAEEGDGKDPLSLTPTSRQVDSWIVITEDSEVIMLTGYMDQGTGIQTAMHQIAAEELDVSFESVSSVFGDTELTSFAGISEDSQGVPTAGRTTRIAAAAAREALGNLGAERLGVSTQQIDTADGHVFVKASPSDRISYGELFGGRRFNIEMSLEKNNFTFDAPTFGTTALLKTVADGRKVIGKSVERVDIPSKVFGTHEFVHNVRIPGMWHGRPVFPPSERVLSIISIDESSISDISDVELVRKGNYIGVIAKREENAIKAARMLKVEWEEAAEQLPVHGAEQYEGARRAKVRRVERDTDIGDPVAAIAGAARKYKQTYLFPYQLHVMNGPSCSLADVREDGTTVWSGTQNPHGDRDVAAQILGIDQDEVRLIWRQASGGYGRLTHDDSVADAVLMSHLSGRPVRVQWMRHDEHGWEPISPAMPMDIEAGVDENGNLVGLNYQHWTARHQMVPEGHLLAWRFSGKKPGEYFAWGGGIPNVQYDIPNILMKRNVTEDILRPQSVRTPGLYQTQFCLDSFVDEIAADLDEDPIAFRLRHLTKPRPKAVVEEIAKRSNWKEWAAGRAARREKLKAGGTVEGRGISLVWKNDGLQSAIAHVSVNTESGEVRVLKVWAVADIGEVINPDGLRHQIEGGTLQGISRALFEVAKYENSRRVSLDWYSYPVIRYKDLPEIDIHLIDNPDIQFLGGGENGTAPLAGAIGNAIFDATGARLREVPFLPERVKAAIS